MLLHSVTRPPRDSVATPLQYTFPPVTTTPWDTYTMRLLQTLTLYSVTTRYYTTPLLVHHETLTPCWSYTTLLLVHHDTLTLCSYTTHHGTLTPRWSYTVLLIHQRYSCSPPSGKKDKEKKRGGGGFLESYGGVFFNLSFRVPIITLYPYYTTRGWNISLQRIIFLSSLTYPRCHQYPAQIFIQCSAGSWVGGEAEVPSIFAAQKKKSTRLFGPRSRRFLNLRKKREQDSFWNPYRQFFESQKKRKRVILTLCCKGVEVLCSSTNNTHKQPHTSGQTRVKDSTQFDS